jgi:hypothetical protein
VVKFEFRLSDEEGQLLVDIIRKYQEDAAEKAQDSDAFVLDREWWCEHAAVVGGIAEAVIVGSSRG